MQRIECQALVTAASLGGVMAAYQLARQGVKTVLLSHHKWIGGQLTSQGVPPDEHAYIEYCGASDSYYQFRQFIRDHYRSQSDFIDNSITTPGLNPGDGWVSRLCFEPELAESYLQSLLAPYLASGILSMQKIDYIESVDCRSGHIHSVTCINQRQQPLTIQADYVLDATDTGDILALADLPYRLGKEARSEFAESLAPSIADKGDQQPVTWVFALQKQTNSANTEKPKQPENYEFWQNYQVPGYGHNLLSNILPDGGKKSGKAFPLFADDDDASILDLWRYRRVIAKRNWPDADKADTSLINWAQNDYHLTPYILTSEHCDGTSLRAHQQQVEAGAKELSRAILHWLQTDAIAKGNATDTDSYQLQPAPGLLGSDDGFAQQVYVRESRRIKGVETLSLKDIELTPTETGVSAANNSVGIGLYNIDIHPTCKSMMGANARARPFEIPLGIFISTDVDNLIPACKNISVTHLVNAATRVHPIEWMVGEIAAMIAGYCLHKDVPPIEIYQSPERVRRLQKMLTGIGVPIHWPEDYASTTRFNAVQTPEKAPEKAPEQAPGQATEQISEITTEESPRSVGQHRQD